jgi:hypothetical protein
LGLKHETPLLRVAFNGLALVTGPRDQLWAMVWSIAPIAGCPGRHVLFIRLALAGYPLCFGCLGFPGRRNITGAYLIAIDVPFRTSIIFNGLTGFIWTDCLVYGRQKRRKLQKTITALFSTGSL